MARVSLDDVSSSQSSKGGSSRSSSSSAAGGKASKGGSAGLDSKQKVKAGVAIAVIVAAGGFIVWNTGLLSSGPRADPNAVDATAEQVQQYNDNLQQEQQQQQRSGGNRRVAPMPLGAN